MSATLNDISAVFFSTPFKEVSTEELQSLSQKYPYCASTQLLLSQKLHQEDHPDYQKQWEKTLLYINTPLLLQHFINTTSENASTESADVLPVKEDGTLDISLPPLKIEPLDPENAQFTFTPYYTVDYFAYQGIKIKDDAKNNDQFSKQLKSFTSWLKQMRRLPEAEVYTNASSAAQPLIEKMAEQSVTGENANTEAMAEVWLKQSNPQKAIEIYQKLSLQNPAKRSYFAAKIEHLKKLL